MITLSAAATQKEGSGRGGGKQGGVQSLCQWAEVPGHPGLITAVMQASNNPVVLMLTPTNIFVQEIKVHMTEIFTMQYGVNKKTVLSSRVFFGIGTY